MKSRPSDPRYSICGFKRRRTLETLLGVSVLGAGCDDGAALRHAAVRAAVERAHQTNQSLRSELWRLPDESNCAEPNSTAQSLADHVLVERLERATVMILVPGGGMGSGFFVTPHTIMTNRHVIENSKDGKVIVVSRALTTLHRGTVLRSTVSSDIGAADFALIRLDQGSAPGVLPFASTVRKLNDVIAAGYPALTVQTDSSFRRLLGGDLAAAPDLNLTAGVVQAIQEMRTGLQQVLHTAQISSGNSGGPLVDRCGRVVGVNTFINRDKDDVARANYALHSKAAVAFLAATGVPIRPTSSTCG